MDNYLRKYSNFKTVNRKANQLYKRDVFLSTRKDKKYMIMNDKNKWVHFGQFGYEDYTKHLDEQREQQKLKEIEKIILLVRTIYQ